MLPWTVTSPLPPVNIPAFWVKLFVTVRSEPPYLKLPYVMGLEVLKWIRQKHGAGLIVILLTASAADADIATAYRLGANAFLTKPSTARGLEEMAGAIRDFWLKHNTLPRESHLAAARSSPVRAFAAAFKSTPLAPFHVAGSKA